MKKIFAVLAFLLLFVTTALGQIITPVKWTITLDGTASPELTIVFTATLDKGWHLYDMNLPAGGPVSTSFTFETLRGLELVGSPVPSTAAVTAFDDTFDMDLRWYVETVTFRQKVKVTDSSKFRVAGAVEYMTCNDAMCLPPENKRFRFDSKDLHAGAADNPTTSDNPSATSTLRSVDDGSDTVTTGTTVVTADGMEGTYNGSTVSGRNITGGDAGGSTSLWEPVVDDLRAFGDLTLSAAGMSWIYIFFAGFVGGLLALLTPCVWPMIPMTVSFFLKRTKDRKKAVADALTYALAIVVIYLSMGLVVTGIFGAGTLNDMATNAVFNILFFALLVVFAAAFFGAFELTLPASWTSRLDRKADTATGRLSIFFMAFTLVLVSFSCTGPIIGTLLVEAASMGSIAGPAIGMTGFAVALSVPFALFAVFPNLLQNMPRSGGWLNMVKVTLGFLELALALKFLSVADLAYGWAILDREVFISLWIVIFALLGVYLLGGIRFPHDGDGRDRGRVSVGRLFAAIVSFSFTVYMVPGLWGAPLKSVSAFAPPLYTQDFSLYDSEVHAAFDDYDAGMQYARRMGKPVIIDFSGFGCVNCRKMEASVWTDPRVKRLLEKDYVLITLFVDDKTRLTGPVEVEEYGKTRRLKTVGEKWSYLQRSKFGANAQPFYILLGNDGKPLGPSYSYDEDINKYIKFLSDGLANYHP
ncbi:MAG: thioredoxin family protein [Tannerellaceae bacterium]|jgi:thiol:disulfide interchange protein DsbD|nr:thioredoxin family protein [Tannerellaceae bacterium]